MYRVTLINPPFAAVSSPSIALTQLKAVVDDLRRSDISVRMLYINQDFAEYLGVQLYEEMSRLESSMCGLGDWFFRPYAFPDLADNERQCCRFRSDCHVMVAPSSHRVCRTQLEGADTAF